MVILHYSLILDPLSNIFSYLNKQYVRVKRCTEIEFGFGAYSQYVAQNDVKEIGQVCFILEEF